MKVKHLALTCTKVLQVVIIWHKGSVTDTSPAPASKEQGVLVSESEQRAEDDVEDDKEIIGADLTRFRGVAARCNYLSFDRPD